MQRRSHRAVCLVLTGLALLGGLLAPAPAGAQAPVNLQPFVDLRTTLFSSLANEVGLLPSPTGGGFTYEFDPALGVFTRGSQSFGSIFGERAETTGKGRFTFTAAYSRHTFDEVDGVDARDGSLTAVFLPTPGFLANPRLFDLPLCATFNPLEIREDVTADVGSLSALYGVTDDLDVGVTIPILRVAIKERVRVRRSSFDSDFTCTGEATNEFRPSKAEATGIGDVSFRGKYRLGRWRTETARVSLATSLDVRVPTGDEGDRNAYKAPDAGLQSDVINTPTQFRPATVGGTSFRLGDPPLGTGIVRVKPQVILTLEWGAFSLNGSTGFEFGTTEGITNDVLYQIGAQYTVLRRVTLIAELLGRSALQVDRRRIRTLDICGLFEIDISPQGNCVQGGQRTPGADLFNPDPFAGSRARSNRVSAAFGAKANPIGALLVFVNFLIPIDDSGFRDDVVFTVGAEWGF
jgi:hypothetical protein